jgi:hypothetical protein
MFFHHASTGGVRGPIFQTGNLATQFEAEVEKVIPRPFEPERKKSVGSGPPASRL